jgi:hypothetical protein
MPVHVLGETSAPARNPLAVQAIEHEGEVFTRAIVRSVYREGAGRRHYIRLKLVPGGKIPFTTLTYRVMDPSLVMGLREGDSVAFRAERRDGENVLIAIRQLPPCQRFGRCE